MFDWVRDVPILSLVCYLPLLGAVPIFFMRDPKAIARYATGVAVADFLLFGCLQDPAATTFAQLQRLAPAHALSTGGGTPVVRRYWALPADGRVRYRRSADYIDHFSALFRAAVADRVRDDRPAVWLSGGLDSTAIAATS